MAQSLESKIRDFLDVWQAKVGQRATDLLNQTIDNPNQLSDMEAKFEVSIAKNGNTKLSLFYRTDDGRSYWQFIEYGVNGLEQNYSSRYSFKSRSPVPQKAVLGFIDKRSITLKSLRQYSKKNFKGISLSSRKKVRKSLKGLSFEEERKTLSFILGRSIKKHGIKPRPFIKDIMTDELMTELKVGMAKIFGEEIVATFRQAD